MYAVVATGGKQYRVEPGDELAVEKLDAEVGAVVHLTPVLVVDDDGGVTTGRNLDGQRVDATVVGHGKGDKIRVFTYKNKTRQRKRRGHRQHLTRIRIEEIGASPAPPAGST